MQAFQLRIDLGGMGAPAGAGAGASAGGQAAEGVFAGVLASAGVEGAGAPLAGVQPVPVNASASGSLPAQKAIDAQGLQVLQPGAVAEPAAIDADAALPVPLPQVPVAAPGELPSQVPGKSAGEAAPDGLPFVDAPVPDGEDGAEAADAAAMVVAFVMPAPLPAPQPVVSAPVQNGLQDGALNGADGLRGSITPALPDLPQPGGQPQVQPGMARPQVDASLSAPPAPAGGDMPSAEAGKAPAATQAMAPAGADTGSAPAPGAVPQAVQQLTTAWPQAGAGLEVALAAAGLTASEAEALQPDVLAALARSAQGEAVAIRAGSTGSADAQIQTQSQPQPQAAAAPQAGTQAQARPQPVSPAGTPVAAEGAASQPVAATAAPAVDAQPDGVETLRFAIAAGADDVAGAPAARPEILAQQAVASAVANAAASSLTAKAVAGTAAQTAQADEAVQLAVQKQAADKDGSGSRYRVADEVSSEKPVTQPVAMKGTQAADLAGASATVNAGQAAANAAAPDDAEADKGPDPAVALDARAGRMDFTGFGRADGQTATGAGTAQASVSGQVPTQAQAQAAASQIAGQIQLQSRAGQSRFQMRLDPPELGRIEVHMRVKAGGEVEAHLIVDKSETLDMFMRDQKGLERALEQIGLKAEQGGLQFSLRDEGNGRQFAFSGDGQGNGSGQSGRQDQQRGQDGQAAERGISERVVQLYRQNGRSGVDIRI
ncbi:flagellar hook-length control protein FliK [Pannonibacter indicus]|uniref:Flagellar hook-length control protein FliK n=1 Tax=Pannonibacter indicus TaxID=466044 RepID=A0A0K6HMK0_9HYPH|nr:flagellar hook-length control protein FliK [Pannonibacter indicus]CUA92277.1 Flagellar hook-length control protein FliK [Pannonibacter indicus]